MKETSENAAKEAVPAAVVEQPKFDIDKALDTKGFSEFLANHPDSQTFDMENEEDLKNRFECFEAKEQVKREMTSLYSGHIEKEMGIKLDSDDKSSIDAYLEQKAIEDPEGLLELRDKLIVFKELPGQIKSLESRLGELGSADKFAPKLEELKNEQRSLTLARKYSGFGGNAKYAFMHLKVAFNGLLNIGEMLRTSFMPDYEPSAEYLKFREELHRATEDRKAVLAMNEKHGVLTLGKVDGLLKVVQTDIHNVEETLGKIKNAKEMKELSDKVFDKVREDLLAGVSDIAELTSSIQAKAAEKLEGMLNGAKSVKDLDAAQKTYESLKSNGTGETGVNPLENMDGDEFQGRIDASLEKVVSEEIMQTIVRANMGKHPLTTIEKSLEGLLNREKLGSKEGDELKTFISQSLEEASANLGDTTEDKAKRLIISRILIKMEKNN